MFLTSMVWKSSKYKNRYNDEENSTLYSTIIVIQHQRELYVSLRSLLFKPESIVVNRCTECLKRKQNENTTRCKSYQTCSG